MAGREQPGTADRRRDLPDDRPPRPPVRRGRLPAPVPAPFQPHLAGPRRPRGRPDGTGRLGLPADAPPLRRQRPQRPRPPHLRPHHDRHLTAPAVTAPARALGRRLAGRHRRSPWLRIKRGGVPGQSTATRPPGWRRIYAPRSSGPESLNARLHEPPKASDVPHRNPTSPRPGPPPRVPHFSGGRSSPGPPGRRQPGGLHRLRARGKSRGHHGSRTASTRARSPARTERRGPGRGRRPSRGEENYGRPAAKLPAASTARAAGRGAAQAGHRLVPAAPGRRGQIGQDGTGLHRRGALVRRRLPAQPGGKDQLGPGGHPRYPAVDGAPAGPVQQRVCQHPVPGAAAVLQVAGR